MISAFDMMCVARVAVNIVNIMLVGGYIIRAGWHKKIDLQCVLNLFPFIKLH